MTIQIEMGLNEIRNKYIDIVASNLHYQDCIREHGSVPKTAQEVLKMNKGWRERFQDDSYFNARVESMVAALMTVLY